jgi:hypothetical protein
MNGDNEVKMDVYNCTGIEGLGDFWHGFYYRLGQTTAAQLQRITGSSARITSTQYRISCMYSTYMDFMGEMRMFGRSVGGEMFHRSISRPH